MSYLYVLATIAFTVYAQIVIKWQVMNAGNFPVEIFGKILFLAKLMWNPWIVSAFLAALLAAVSWMAAMTKLQLSHAYPLMGLTFVLVLLGSGYFFHEPITFPKIVGVMLIVLGMVFASQG